LRSLGASRLRLEYSERGLGTFTASGAGVAGLGPPLGAGAWGLGCGGALCACGCPPPCGEPSATAAATPLALCATLAAGSSRRAFALWLFAALGLPGGILVRLSAVLVAGWLNAPGMWCHAVHRCAALGRTIAIPAPSAAAAPAPTPSAFALRCRLAFACGGRAMRPIGGIRQVASCGYITIVRVLLGRCRG
jgi:hypothetical protein